MVDAHKDEKKDDKDLTKALEDCEKMVNRNY